MAAGWNVGANGASTEQVGQEVEVEHQPTASGKGKADYVLWGDNGKPLGVIEAKKTAVDRRGGPDPGQVLRRWPGEACTASARSSSTPTATTSGSGTTLTASRPASSTASTPRTAWNTCIYQRANQEPLTKIGPDPQIAGRMYQIEAIKRVVERFAAKHRKALIVQATGTGKTRVAISLCDAADPGEVGQAHPVPVRPQGAPQAGPQRLQGVPARRAAHLRHRRPRRRTATSASTSPPTRR